MSKLLEAKVRDLEEKLRISESQRTAISTNLDLQTTSALKAIRQLRSANLQVGAMKRVVDAAVDIRRIEKSIKDHMADTGHSSSTAGDSILLGEAHVRMEYALHELSKAALESAWPKIRDTNDLRPDVAEPCLSRGSHGLFNADADKDYETCLDCKYTRRIKPNDTRQTLEDVTYERCKVERQYVTGQSIICGRVMPCKAHA